MCGERSARRPGGSHSLLTDFDLNRLRGHRLFVGTPMYSGQCHSEFAFAIAQLAGVCTRLGIELQYFFATNEALVTRARNLTVDTFLRSRDDTLLFVDADIGFEPRDVLHMLALLANDRDRQYDVLAAPYPLKRLRWDFVLKAAQAGLADTHPERLAQVASQVAVSPAHEKTFALNKPVEVTQTGTGFMMIRRATFERFRERYPELAFRPQRMGLDNEASEEIGAYFETAIDSKAGNLRAEMSAFLSRRPDATAAELLAFVDDAGQAMHDYSGLYVSEDFAFCRRVREAGMKVWLCPWMELSHTGTLRYASRIADLAAIGAL